MNGIDAGSRVLPAIIKDREPDSSVTQVLPCFRTLDALQKQLAKG